MDDRTRAVARVWGIRSSPVGTAFLVGPRTLLTCTHVVADARGFGRLVTPAAGTEVAVDFPACPSERWWAELVFREPIEGDVHGDIAVLELEADAPGGIRPAVLIEAPDLWRHRCGTFGFPRGYDNGASASGVLLSVEGTGWLEIDDHGGRQVEPGFSGAAVWDEEYPGGVVAMVVAARRGDAAFAIPASSLMASWPPLRGLARPPSPYRGLLSFTPDDASVYCGRGEDVTALLALVDRETVVAVVGPSGVGKSSLVLAGLVPRFKDRGIPTTIVRLRPRMNFLEMLTEALVADSDQRSVQTGTTPAWLEENTTRDNVDALRERLLSGVDAERLVVVVDQLDEVLAVDPELCSEVDRVVEVLAARHTSQPTVTVVAIVRDDFLPLVEKFVPTVWHAWQRQRFSVRPMSREQLRDAITGPLQTVRPVQLAAGLAELVLDDAPSGPSALPLVEHTLSWLWDKQENAGLTLSTYRAIGGVGAGQRQDHYLFNACNEG